MSAQSSGAPASSTQPAFSVELPDDLIIDILPRGYTSWTGTLAQLQEEGILPAGFSVPDRFEFKTWEAGKFAFDMWRRRPPGAKGKRSAWETCDYFVVRRTLTAHRYDGWSNAIIYDKQRELDLARSMQTAAWREQFHRYLAAQTDRAFKAFLGDIPALAPRKRGGASKASMQVQGGRHAA